MKANELMTGDYLSYNGQIIKVANITKKKVGYHIKENECRMHYARLCECNPISITPEILEKIGFEKTWQDNFVYDNEDIGLIITFHPKETNYTNGTYDYIDIEKGCVTITEMPIEFVHQLQHGLRLCEVSIEIIEL